MSTFLTNPLWFLTRSTGVISFVLLTATVTLGLLSTLRTSSTRWPRYLTQGLHRNLSLLAVAFLAGHIVTTILDGYVPIGWANAVVPFDTGYRTPWLGLGTLAVDAIVVLVLTSLVRVRLGYRAWRAVHGVAYATWPLAVGHFLGTGTDRGTRWALGLVLLSGALVLGALAVRLSAADAEPGAPVVTGRARPEIRVSR
ncbi:MAG: ferric reductase-like transmembrane domain-containing protein [Actinomycetes bacterium]